MESNDSFHTMESNTIEKGGVGGSKLPISKLFSDKNEPIISNYMLR